MYAKSLVHDPYHLLTVDFQQTLCGLDVALIVIDRPAKTSTLHSTSQKPTDRALCPKCAKLKAEQRLVATPAS
jgi:hypothetical protein